MSQLRLFPMLVALLLMLTSSASLVASGESLPTHADAESLFSQAGPTLSDLPNTEEHSVLGAAARTREVVLSPWVGEPDGIAVGDQVILNLFPEKEYVATVDRVTTNVNGTLSVRGRLHNYPDGYIIVSTHQDRTFASISIPQRNQQYAVVYEPGEARHYVIEVDAQKLDVLDEAPPLTASAPDREEEEGIAAGEEPVAANLGPGDPATIDVMVVYTPAAESWADDTSGIECLIDQKMEASQLVLDNSETGVTLRLVHSAQVDYEEGTDGYIYHLERLTFDDEHNPPALVVLVVPSVGGRL